MASVKLMLLLDDVELGMGLSRIATLFFQIGDLTSGDQSLYDAGICYARAERISASLSLADREVAQSSLTELRKLMLDVPAVRVATSRQGPIICYTPLLNHLS